MSKFESDIRKKLKKIHSEAAAKVRKLLKSKKALLVDTVRWDQPGDFEFKKFGPAVGAYLISCGVIKGPNAIDINDLVNDPMAFSLVTREELEEFKTVTWPKIYAKWRKEDREPERQRIKAEIESLQKQLKKLED